MPMCDRVGSRSKIRNPIIAMSLEQGQSCRMRLIWKPLLYKSL
jgi:hypothetical protein